MKAFLLILAIAGIKALRFILMLIFYTFIRRTEKVQGATMFNNKPCYQWRVVYWTLWVIPIYWHDKYTMKTF